MNFDNIDIPNEWELICDYNPVTRDVEFCYYNNELEQQESELPAAIATFISHTSPQDWIGHLSTSYLPFKQFYTHRTTNVSIWHQPSCLTQLNESYIEDVNDWSIRSKKLEMTPEIRDALLDFDNISILPKSPSAIQQFQHDLIKNNRRKYCSNGKVTKDFVCFYRNNVTQQCLFELPPILDQFQLQSNTHRDWTPQISSTIDRFFYMHTTSVYLWDVPLAYKLNRDKHLANATKDDWRIFVSSEHKRPLYIHSQSKLTQFELPEPLSKAEKEITDPLQWQSGINPITNIPYYFNTQRQTTIWHLPTALATIKDNFEKKKAEEEQEAKKVKKSYKDFDFVYWEVQYVAYQPQPQAASQPETLEQPQQPEKHIVYYKHRYTQECVLDLPSSTAAFIKTTKKNEWAKVNIQNTPLVYYEHSTKFDRDPYKVLPSQESDESVGTNSTEGVCVWTSPLDIITNHAQVVKQTEAQMVMATSNDSGNDLDPEDDIDNWIIYYDPNATNPNQHETITQAAKAKQRKTSQSTSNEDGIGGLKSGFGFNNYGGSGRDGDDDDDDDDDDGDGGLGGGLVSSCAGSGLGELLSSTTNFQLQGLRLDQIANLSKAAQPKNSGGSQQGFVPRTELEEGVEIGAVGTMERRSSFSTFSFSTTQRHLNLSARGQQLYFNIITKRIQPELPTCFELFQQALENDGPHNWESAVGKIAPFPFYRFKAKRSIVMWHEPIVVRAYRMNDYSIIENEDLSKTVQDWVIRMVAETNTAYYKNIKTHWYQNTIPEALDEYQSGKKNVREWESFMSNTCIGVVIYTHVLPGGDTGCSLLQKPDCIREKIQQPDINITAAMKPISTLDTRFNQPGTTYRENVNNWILQYNATSNTIYYRNIETHCLTINIPKPLYLLGINRYSTYQQWTQSTVFFDSDGDVMTTAQKDQCDDQIAKDPSLVKGGRKLYTEKACYVFNDGKIKVFHRPHVLRDHLRQIETTLDWSLIRSTDNIHFLYKNKNTGELTADLPQSIQKWLNDDVEANKPEHWIGCVDTTLKQSYYKHKPTNLMIASQHEPPVLTQIRTQPYTTEQELAQWTIFANKVDNRCYYQNKVTKQCIIGSIPKILLTWSSLTKQNEWTFVEPTGTISKGYWYHLKTGTRMWERPNFVDVEQIVIPRA